MIIKPKNLWFLFIGFVLLATIFVRLYNLDTAPPSLYWEEAALGYDAYSILKTGKDHHGNVFPIFAFESFGDWKPAGYFYAVVPFIPIVGLNEWAVRLPSALAGIGIVVCTAYLGKRAKLPFWLVFAVAAFCPWAIHFSRAGWEVNLATFFNTIGVALLVSGLRNKQIKVWLLILGIILLGFGAYTYHANRLLAPVLLIGSIVYWWLQNIEAEQFVTTTRKLVTANIRSIMALFLTTAIIFIPLVVASLTNSELRERYAQTGNVFDESIIIESNLLREQAQNSVVSKVFYHRYVLWAKFLGTNVLQQLNPGFLALSGDRNLRHGTQFFGLIYPTDYFFFCLGVLIYLRRRDKFDLLLLFWLLSGLVVVALARPVPQTLRLLPTLPVFVILIATGMYKTYLFVQKNLKRELLRGTLYFLLVGLYLFQFILFMKYYLEIYPHASVDDWQYGYKQMVVELQKAQALHPNTPVYVTREKGRPAMFYWFFAQIDPVTVQKANQIEEKDQGEFTTFEKISFERSINEVPEQAVLLVASESQTERYLERARSKGLQNETLVQILDLNGKITWVITEIH